MNKLWNVLKEAKDLKWVELSHCLDNESPYWSGIPDGSVKLGEVVFDWGNPMLECQIQSFRFPGQFGTHIDFPAHFVQGAATAESFGMKNAVFPLCVVDITDKVKDNPTYCVTADDLCAGHGNAPFGAEHSQTAEYDADEDLLQPIIAFAERGALFKAIEQDREKHRQKGNKGKTEPGIIHILISPSG